MEVIHGGGHDLESEVKRLIEEFSSINLDWYFFSYNRLENKMKTFQGTLGSESTGLFNRFKECLKEFLQKLESLRWCETILRSTSSVLEDKSNYMIVKDTIRAIKSDMTLTIQLNGELEILLAIEVKLMEIVMGSPSKEPVKLYEYAVGDLDAKDLDR